MTKAAFTPGPWSMEIEPERYPESDDADLPAIVRDPAGKVVVYLPETYGPGMAPDYEANARLIAAAPDLYEALTEAAEYIAATGRTGFYDEGGADALSSSLRALLAKARGEAA